MVLGSDVVLGGASGFGWCMWFWVVHVVLDVACGCG